MKKVLNKVLNSKEFKGAHKTAQTILAETLTDLDKQNYLQESDYANLMMLISSMDMYYCLRDEVKQTGYSYINAKGQTCVSPLISPMAAQNRVAMSILNDLGGSTKSRRHLNQKELTQAEVSPLDNLFTDSDDFSNLESQF